MSLSSLKTGKLLLNSYYKNVLYMVGTPINFVDLVFEEKIMHPFYYKTE